MFELKIQGISVCQYHWLIDSPNGPVSSGICLICGEEREFRNYVEPPSFGATYIDGGTGYSRLRPDKKEAMRRPAQDSRNE